MTHEEQTQLAAYSANLPETQTRNKKIIELVLQGKTQREIQNLITAEFGKITQPRVCHLLNRFRTRAGIQPSKRRVPKAKKVATDEPAVA